MFSLKFMQATIQIEILREFLTLFEHGKVGSG